MCWKKIDSRGTSYCYINLRLEVSHHFYMKVPSTQGYSVHVVLVFV